ncbi:acetolactate synthase large subunit IlvG [Planomonospora parontospora subsp. parontospora]|uniref:Acetolactate synthase n=2 Tax=Planomonospora parontospora TaxID=58119 RepID=A0AA37BN94_9ACTN|nr:acetolactate synthase [Planomonospora parontospora]GGK97078.1 putative acetolactate synthase [Planomonospora parontospora]GII12707.1 acetolactate synthase large subunit IlvG [Planomonospora parontospora subsp. parontospora]
MESSPKHAGDIAVAVSKAYGIETMFTLSGGHVFPLYDGAVHEGVSILDVRHEQSAVFAAEATARLTRRPGLAVLTAGPGVTNGVSGVATAHFNGSPVVVMGGRAPRSRWGSGALQEMDHPPLLAPVTKLAFTGSGADSVGQDVEMAFRTAIAPHRGPVFLDFHMDDLFAPAAEHHTETLTPSPLEPDAGALAQIAGLLAEAERPILVLGSDVWMDRAEEVARSFAEEYRLPVIPNGQGRGILPAGHELLVNRARGLAFSQADLVIVAGTPLDFRLGYGWFGGKEGAPLAKVVHLTDAPSQVATHMKPAGAAAGDLSLVFWGLTSACAEAGVSPKTYAPWLSTLAEASRAAIAGDVQLLESASDPIHPMRIYGELGRILADDAVVIGDGGDFVSYAGKYVEPRQPGNWLDPGPYGCLGTGLGYAIAARLARPSSQVVLLLGDGAAGFSLMDVDTLVRHRLPVVMICGNNGMWGLEKHPMQMLYGYDVAAELQPQCRYDQVVTALGGGGELVTDPSQIGPALRRAFDSGVPYMVNIATDPSVAYPRTTTGV